MIKWLKCLIRLHKDSVYSSKQSSASWKAITQLQDRSDNLVDRISQLEQTVQSLSDENQLLIQTVYQKGKQNG